MSSEDPTQQMLVVETSNSNQDVSTKSRGGATSNQNNNNNNTEDVVAKYKRLLSLARSSLEANQAALASKDQQISELMAVLDEERNKRAQRNQKEYDDPNQQFPRQILCRVDVNDLIWILLEFDHQDEWKSFNNEESLEDYIKRIPGPPLQSPQKCLSSEESSRLVEDSKRKTERIIEEFRKYKVRMEIALKQRDAENNNKAIGGGISTPNNSNNNHHGNFHYNSGNGLSPYQQASSSSSSHFQGKSTNNLSLSSNLEKALSQGTMGESVESMNDLQRLKVQLQEQEVKWRHACEKLAKENELLKTKGAESVVAGQWRVRYENCLREKEEIAQKLNLYTQLSAEVTSDGRTIEQIYIELQEEFKGLRKRLYELMNEYMSKENLGASEIEDFLQEISRVLQYYHIDHVDLDDSKLLAPKKPTTPRSAAANASGDGHSANTKGMAESKVQYVRQMVFQFLMCREPEVKQHIEKALMTLFRFSEDEKEAILMKEKEENEDAFSSITNFLGSFTT